MDTHTSKRKSTGKRLRFEIFKRDGFTCQYCGGKPPAVVLEVDHIHPVAAGGSSDELNLITACEACNAGKSDKQLSVIAPRPDADLLYLEAQQEIVEAKRFLALRFEMGELTERLCWALEEDWKLFIGAWVRPPAATDFEAMLRSYSVQDVSESIKIAGWKKRKSGGSDLTHAGLIVPYMWGILKKMEQDREALS